MNRLKCGGKPMLTSIQFYREARLPDLLRQREAFISFAASHLNLEGRNLYISTLQNITQNPNLLENNRWKLELQKKISDEPKLTGELKSTFEEVKNYFSKVSFTSNEQREHFLAFVTLSVLIAKMNPNSWKKYSSEYLVSAYQGKVQAEKNIAALRFGQEKNLVLTPVKNPYIVSYSSDYHMRPGQQIKTYTIAAASVGTHDRVVLDTGTQRKYEIMRGESLLVNVVENTIVAVLPNKISVGGTKLERKANGSIYLNGKILPGTQNVTSFAVQENTGLYGYADNGRLNGNYLDRHPNCGKYIRKIVEIALSKDYYYLLSSDGMLDSNDPIREQIDHPLASLEALKKLER